MIDLFQPGAYARAAGGNLERPEIQSPVVRWMAWSINPDNGGGGSPTVWRKARDMWEQAGIADFPWLHCRSLADVQRLLDVASLEGSPAIGLNVEDVFADKLSLARVADMLAGWSSQVHMPTLPWVQNDQGWAALSRAIAALEIFPDEQTSLFPNGYDPAVVEQCVGHAFAQGLTQVTLMFKTKPPLSAAGYGSFFSSCHSLYTADDITPDAESWARWALTGPCEKIAPVEKIGRQDGLTGFYNWLVKQPGVPQPGPNYDPNNIDTWPWPQKLRRTLTLLKQAHDR